MINLRRMNLIMECSVQELERNIFKKRKYLNELVAMGLDSKEVQKHSRDLDNLINKHYKIKKNNKK